MDVKAAATPLTTAGDGARQRGRLAWRVGLSALLCVAFLHLAQEVNHLLTSDDLYFETLYHDLVHARNLMPGWAYQPAQSLFPDFVLFFPLRALIGDIGWAYTAYAAVFTALLFLLLFAIARQVTARHDGIVDATLAGGALLLACMGSQVETRCLLLPGFHTGVLLVGFGMLWLGLRALDRGVGLLACGALFLATALGTWSDRILVPEFVAPLLLVQAAFLFAGHLKPRAFWGLGASQVGGCVVGIHLTKHYFGPGSPWGQSPYKDYLAAFFTEHKDLSYRLGNLPLVVKGFPGIAVAGLLCVTGAGLVWRRRWAAFRGSTPAAKAAPWIGLERQETFFALFCLLSVPACLANAFLFAEGCNSRYLLPAYLLACFYPAWLYADGRHLGPWLRRGVLLTAALGIAFLAVDWGSPQWPHFSTPYPDDVAWLDQTCAAAGVKYIYTDYWRGRHTTFLSRQGLVACPLYDAGDSEALGDLGYLSWIDSSFRYRSDASGQWPAYKAVLTTDLSLPLILRDFGPPAREATFKDDHLLFYDRDSDLAFRNFLRKSMDPYVVTALDPPALSHNGSRVISLPPRVGLPVAFAQPVSGRMLMELWVETDATVDVQLRMGPRSVGQLRLAPVAGSGIWPRYVRLPIPEHAQMDSLLLSTPGPKPIAVASGFLYYEPR